MSQRLSVRTRSRGLFLVLLCLCLAGLGATARAAGRRYEIILPALNPDISPLAPANRPQLFNRLLMSFGADYTAHYLRNRDRNLADGMTIYYLQRELQALVDMWRATGDEAYLKVAAYLALQAIDEATVNSRPMLWHGQARGDRPCFYLDTVAEQTGGHNQLCDFQGGAGFLTVARALHEAGLPAWKEIADFVERDIVGKWLYYKPSITEAQLLGPRSSDYILAVLNTGRDVREHFACICLDLHGLGYDGHPYRSWANLLVELYLSPRYDANQPAPCRVEVSGRIPGNWGLLDRTEDDYFWYSIPGGDPNNSLAALDTSHANRTAWLAVKAWHEGLIPESTVLGLVGTLRHRIWAPEKGPLYFNNYVDGGDGELDGLGPGRGGNIWFGWHRLAVFDPELEDLFLSIAYDLTNGGPNIPYGAQNKAMQDAPLCLQAWAARLLSSQGRPPQFP